MRRRPGQPEPPRRPRSWTRASSRRSPPRTSSSTRSPRSSWSGCGRPACAGRRSSSRPRSPSCAPARPPGRTRSARWVTLGNAQLELIRAQTDLATAEAGLARLIGETGRVKAADDSAFYQVMAAPDTGRAPGGGRRRRVPRIQSAERGGRCRPGQPQGLPLRLLAEPLALGQHGVERQPVERLRPVQPAAAQSRAALEPVRPLRRGSWRSRSGRRASRWPMPPRPTSGARWRRS